MTLFGDEVAELVKPELFELYGETITYTPKGGAGVSITAYVDRQEMGEVTSGQDGSESARMVSVTISTAAADGVAAPAVEDKLTIDGLDWGVKRLGPVYEALQDLEVIRLQPTELSHPGYRREG